MNLLAWLRKRATLRRDRRKRPELDAFNAAAAQLTPDDLAIDCGANVGKFTVPMARTGAMVHAFEPNPAAFAELQRNTAAYPRVQLHHAAVTAVAGPVKLFLHKWADEDPVHWSTGSSILSGKNNVRDDRFTTVEGVAFVDFVRSLAPRKIRLLKMDIEGAEVDVLNRLLDEGLQTFISEAYVETHERRVPALVEPTRKLRERLQAVGAHQFRLDWR
jgi:FkbM family methyltransferase